jgi:hypothetical protein
MHRNILSLLRFIGGSDLRLPDLSRDAVAIHGQSPGRMDPCIKCPMYQMHCGIDKIARRDAESRNKRLFGLTYH